MISLRVPCRGQNMGRCGGEVDVGLSNSLVQGGMNFSGLRNTTAFEILSLYETN
jgi:hypothetical protein